MTQEPGSGAPMSERMQSLLSRAVEDQLSEQRQLAGALSEVRTQLGQLGSQLDALHGGGGSSPRLEEALGAIAGQVHEAVRLLGERLDGVARLVQERGHDLAEQRAILGELKAAVDRHTNALDGMTSGLAALPAFGERIDTLQGGLGGLASRMQGLEELTASVAGLHQRSEALDSGLRELRQAFTGVASRAAQLPSREDLEAVVGRVAESVDGLGGRLSRLETAVPSLLERLDALAEAYVTTKAALQDIQDRLGSQAPAAAADLGAGELTGLLDELAELQDEIAALREQLGAREQLQPREPDADLAAVAERLDAMHAGLFGADGIADRLATLETTDDARVPGVGGDTVEQAVARAVAASERRLADHIDEAILTLAEALLRRRARQRPSGLGAVLGASEVESVAANSSENDAVATPVDLLDDDIDDDAEDEDDADDVINDEVEDEPDEDDEDEADESAAAPEFGHSVGTHWQTPSPADIAAAEAEEPADTSSEVPKKRKPWWRPGG